MHSPTPSHAHLPSQEVNTPRSIIPESAGKALPPLADMRVGRIRQHQDSGDYFSDMGARDRARLEAAHG